MGFGKDVALRLFLSLKKLLFKNPGTTEPEKITRVRLWGKIYGLDSDYVSFALPSLKHFPLCRTIAHFPPAFAPFD